MRGQRPAGMLLSVDCLFLRSPSRVLYRTELIPRAPKWRRTRTPHPESRSQTPELPGSHPSPVRGLLVTYLRWTKTEPTEFSTRPEMFSGIGALPKPATESHVVSRENPVAPRRLKAQGKRATRVGSPCSPDFPKYHELFEEPHHCTAASSSLTAIGREHT